MSHTGLVSVLVGDPNSSEAIGIDTEADGSDSAGEMKIGMEEAGSAGFAGKALVLGGGDGDGGAWPGGEDGRRGGRSVDETLDLVHVGLR
jgi:hypothetical protein